MTSSQIRLGQNMLVSGVVSWFRGFRLKPSISGEGFAKPYSQLAFGRLRPKSSESWGMGTLA